jgi:hypothetical protein
MADHKLLAPSTTRWLVQHNVLKRLLEQWDTLQAYFFSCQGSDVTQGVERIQAVLSRPHQPPLHRLPRWRNRRAQQLQHAVPD